MSEQKHSGPIERVATFAFLFVLLVQSMSVSLEVFLRGKMGSRSIGIRGALALLLIPLWTVAWPQDDPRPLLAFWLCFGGACLAHGVAMAVRFRNGEATHSRYSGLPHLKRLVPFLGETTVKRVVEPAVSMLAGSLVCEWSEPLGSYLIFAGLCLLLSAGVTEAMLNARTRDLNDALVDQQTLAERLRRVRGE